MPKTSDALTIASGSIGLTKSLIDFVPAAAPVIQTVKAINEWVIRQRIDKKMFNTCRDMASGLAYPNEKGNSLQSNIDKADQSIKDRFDSARQSTINFWASGSLGRVMGRDPQTRYLTTTVACLTSYHSPQAVTDAICCMMLDQGGHEKEVSYRRPVMRAPIEAVMSKIVHSVFIHTVNTGHTLNQLPVALQHLHPHTLHPITFAGIVMGVHRSEHDIVVRCNRFLTDLTLWFLHHFEGKLTVTVKGQVLFEEVFGSQERNLVMIVDQLCSEELSGPKRACLTRSTPVTAAISIGNNPTFFLRDHDRAVSVPQSYGRQPLHGLASDSSGRTTSVLSSGTTKACLHCHLSGLAFVARDMSSAKFGVKDSTHDTNDAHPTIGSLMKTHPRLLQMNTGSANIPVPVFVYPDMDLLDGVKPDCSRPSCDPDRPNINDSIDRPGCLRYEVTIRILGHIAHGICDGFGATDVSGDIDSTDRARDVAALLRELIERERVSWNTCVKVVDTNITGMPSASFQPPEDQYAKPCAAIQYGSLVVSAPWLDLHRDIDISDCFSINVSEGNVEMVLGDLAILYCESIDEEFSARSTMVDLDSSSSTEFDATAQPNPGLPSNFELGAEDSAVQQITPTFRVGDYEFKLMAALRCGKAIRLVDFGGLIKKKIRLTSISCQHDPGSKMQTALPVVIDDLDIVLGKWDSDWTAEKDRPPRLRMSKVLTENLELNTVLSVPSSDFYFRDIGICCIDCAIKTKGQNRLHGDFTGSPCSPLLINLNLPRTRRLA